MQKFKDRYQAGQLLAAALQSYTNQPNVIVLALPRGGVPIGFEIAKALKVPLDIYIVRKLGVPGHVELAMGALNMDGSVFFNDELIRELHIPHTAIDQVIAAEQKELSRRIAKYRGNQSLPTLDQKIIILVDDGIATGATIKSAIAGLRKYKIEKLIIAVPVAQRAVTTEIQQLVDEMIVLLQPEDLYAVGTWYEHFDQTEDAEVYKLLKK